MRAPSPGMCCRRWNLHTSTEYIAAFNNDIAHVQANAKLNAGVHRQVGIALSHPGLDLSSAAQRIHHTAEFDEQPVTRRLNQPAMICRDGRIDQFIPDRPKPSQIAVLVSP